MRQLLDEIEKHKDMPFKTGVNDCCLFACDCVKAMTGIDPAEIYRGKYSTEIGAKRALLKYGSIEFLFDKYFNRIDIKSAKRGDVVFYESEAGATVGIKWSGGVLVTGKNGLVIVNDFKPKAVWRVEK